MKRQTLLALLFGTAALATATTASAQSTLAVGDIALTGYHSDNAPAETFSFLLLSDIEAGTEIGFTDNEVAAGVLTSGEGVITWTADMAYTAGTEVMITTDPALVASAGDVTQSGAVQLGGSGDQLIVFQGAAGAETFLHALEMNGGWVDGTSEVPPGLVDGVSAMAPTPERDNGVYDCANLVAGTPAELFAALNTSSNWLWDGATLPIPSACAYAVTTGPPANTDPVIDAHTIPGTADEGAEVSFTASASDADAGDTVHYAWDFGDGTTADTADATHTYSDNGSYAVTLTVTDDNGGSAMVTETIAVTNVAPTIVSLEATPNPVGIGSATVFSATVTDPAGENDPIALQWDFGDGNTSTATTPSHTYGAIGTYTATVVAFDGDTGTATDSFTVEVIAVCGDGNIEGDEVCDTDALAGQTCADFDYLAADGLACAADCLTFDTAMCVAECGNGAVEPGEECDATGEETVDCDLDCTVPVCGDGVCNVLAGERDEDTFCDADCPVCGDGMITHDETCDDGNADAMDGCSDTCEEEDGWICETSDLDDDGVDDPTVCTSVCGDGLVRGDEGCDDANLDAGDGCDDMCAVEEYFVCDDAEPSVCGPGAFCGNGRLDDGEECDDGDERGGDGCSDDCDVEWAWECDGSEPSDCEYVGVCGDGAVDGDEECDDANTINFDGCTTDCEVEEFFRCSGEPSVCFSTSVCGDGAREYREACDDGNTADDDGCSSDCHVEDGWVCDGGEPATCIQDGDGDGVADGDDNCPGRYNADQADSDGDGAGDLCDDSNAPTSNGETPEIAPNADGSNPNRLGDAPNDEPTPAEQIAADGCSSTPSRSASVGWLALGMLGLLVRRRRR